MRPPCSGETDCATHMVYRRQYSKLGAVGDELARCRRALVRTVKSQPQFSPERMADLTPKLPSPVDKVDAGMCTPAAKW